MDSSEFIEHCEAVCLSGARENKWVFIEDLQTSLYYRVTKRFLEGEMRDTLEVCSVNIEPEFQGQGHFSSLMHMIEDLARKIGRAVLIESVLSDRIACLAESRGYCKLQGEGLNYFKEFGEIHVPDYS